MNDEEELLLKGMVSETLERLDDAINGTEQVYHSPSTDPLGVIFPVYQGVRYKYGKETRKKVAFELRVMRTLLKKLGDWENMDFTEQLKRLSQIEASSKKTLAEEPLGLK